MMNWTSWVINEKSLVLADVLFSPPCLFVTGRLVRHCLRSSMRRLWFEISQGRWDPGIKRYYISKCAFHQAEPLSRRILSYMRDSFINTWNTVIIENRGSTRISATEAYAIELTLEWWNDWLFNLKELLWYSMLLSLFWFRQRRHSERCRARAFQTQNQSTIAWQKSWPVVNWSRFNLIQSMKSLGWKSATS